MFLFNPNQNNKNSQCFPKIGIHYAMLVLRGTQVQMCVAYDSTSGLWPMSDSPCNGPHRWSKRHTVTLLWRPLWSTESTTPNRNNSRGTTLPVLCLHVCHFTAVHLFNNKNNRKSRRLNCSVFTFMHGFLCLWFLLQQFENVYLNTPMCPILEIVPLSHQGLAEFMRLWLLC